MNDTTPLERLKLYTGAPPDLRRGMAGAAKMVHFAAGDVFYRQGDVGDLFAVVSRGDIRIFRTSEGGREITLYHVEDGEPCLINMLCVVLSCPAMATARIETPTEAVVFPAATFRGWMRDDEFMRRFVFTSMADRFVGVMTLVEEVAFRKMDARLAGLLVRRFGHAQRSSGVAMTTHEDLAAELGTAREVVSRLLKDFERLGILTLARGRLELLDVGGLDRLAGATTPPRSVV